MDDLIVLGLATIAISCWYFFSFTKFNSIPLPPGPFSWPIIGSLLSLKMPLHIHFHNLSKKYGPIIYLKIGMVPCVVVNDPKAAEQVLKVHDLEFASRPSTELFRIFSYNRNDIILSSPKDENWKKLRKISNMHLFSNRMLQLSARFRASELKLALTFISQASKQAKPVNLRSVFQEFISNSLCFTLFSKKHPQVIEMVDSMVPQLLNLNIGELFPMLDWLDLHGAYKTMNKYVICLKSILDQEIEQHRRRNAQTTVCQDFIDVLISMGDEISHVSMVALLTDMIVAGLETSATTLDWAMAEIIRNPVVMRKSQEELDAVVGTTRIVSEEDLPSLPYIQAIVKEAMRLHPAVPLGVPHYNPNEVKLDKYVIPAGCKVLVNIWAMGQDEAYWTEPHVFRPERFLGSDVSVTGQHFQLIPFSSGRRICVGYPLAMRTISFVIAGLLQAFHWTPVGDINMEEGKMTMTSNRASDLVALATPRMAINYV